MQVGKYKFCTSELEKSGAFIKGIPFPEVLSSLSNGRQSQSQGNLLACCSF
jgi:hypothetical protein